MDNQREILKNIYDVINKIAREMEEEGKDVSDWFYTDEQIEELKKDPKNKFI